MARTTRGVDTTATTLPAAVPRAARTHATRTVRKTVRIKDERGASGDQANEEEEERLEAIARATSLDAADAERDLHTNDNDANPFLVVTLILVLVLLPILLDPLPFDWLARSM